MRVFKSWADLTYVQITHRTRVGWCIGNDDDAVKKNIQDIYFDFCAVYSCSYFCSRASFALFLLSKRKLKNKPASTETTIYLHICPSTQFSTSKEKPRSAGATRVLFSSPSCCLSSSSTSSSSCFSEKHDRPHLYYHITLRASIKKKGLLCLLHPAGMTNTLHIVSPGKQAHTHVCRRVMTIQPPSVQCPRSTMLGVLPASVGCQMVSRGLASHLKSRFQNKCAVK